MKIKLTEKARKGIGLRSVSTGKLTRYTTGDIVEVTDGVANGFINSGMAVECKDEQQEETSDDNEQNEQQEETPDDNEQNEQQEETPDDNEQDYENMTVKQLSQLLKEQGKSTEGNKKELIARLLMEE